MTLTWDNGQGLVFKRTISVDDDYMFKIVDEVENRATAEVSLAPYARIHRYGTPKIQDNWILHEGLIGVIGDARRADVASMPTALEDGDAHVRARDRRLARLHRQILGLRPHPRSEGALPRAVLRRRRRSCRASSHPIRPTTCATPMIVAPGQTRRASTSQLFAGAKQVKILQAYQTEHGIKQFDLLIDWGWFFFITKPLFYLMEAINSVVHNFGVTILILTVLVRLAFFPLANKQFASMAKMKKLQPQMEQLRERYKDDKMQASSRS